MDSNPFLDIENISVVLPNSKKYLFYDFNLKLTNEPIIGLLGSNGSGKTVLAKTLAGLCKVKSGKITLFGEDITKIKTTKRLNLLSLSFQLLSDAFLKQTVKEEVVFNNKLIQLRRKNVHQNLTEQKFEKGFLIGKERQHPLTLSGGEKRKLSFYLLKMNDPELYILDEPTNGLDYFEIQQLKEEIKQLNERKKKVIIITHDIQFLLTLTDQVVILHKDEANQLSSVLYQGSLSSYLRNKTEQAMSFLTIPLEFKIYLKKITSNELSEDITYQKFLQLSLN